MEPMTIHEGLEAMKIIAPYALDMMAVLDKDKGALPSIRILVDGCQENDPFALMRLVALMSHEHVEETIERYKETPGIDLAVELSNLLVINPMVDLLNAAIFLGLANEGLEND